jgi:hypothetical protein
LYIRFVLFHNIIRFPIKAAFLLNQAIRQATSPFTKSLPVTFNLSPRIHIWNICFRVHGEKQIYPNSAIYIYFHTILQDTPDPVTLPIAVDVEDSDEEEGDVDILIGRKLPKNDGVKLDLAAAHNPYYPDVHPPFPKFIT